MFMIRTAFWLSLLILLLPTDEQDQRVVYGNAETAINDLRGFCTRNPGVCEASKSAASTFSTKAQFGAKMLSDFFQKRTGEGVYIPASERSSRRPSFFRGETKNTLTADDRRPSWSVPSSGSGV